LLRTFSLLFLKTFTSYAQYQDFANVTLVLSRILVYYLRIKNVTKKNNFYGYEFMHYIISQIFPEPGTFLGLKFFVSIAIALVSSIII